MPLPTTITWIHAPPNIGVLEIRDPGQRFAYSIQLLNYHEEVQTRPTLDNGPAGYQLRRSTLIQERLFELYINAIRSGVSNTGYFYGAISYQGVWHELDIIRFEGRVVYLTNNPEPHPYHGIGLLYTPAPILVEGFETLEPTLISEFGLPTRVMASLQDRSAHDYLVDPLVESQGLYSDNAEVQPTEPPMTTAATRRSRYLREPVI